MLRRLLHRTKPPTHPRHHHQLTAIKKETEEVRFRVQLLTHERDKKRSFLRQRVVEKNKMSEENQDKGNLLTENHFLMQSVHTTFCQTSTPPKIPSKFEIKNNPFLVVLLLKRKFLGEVVWALH